MGLVQIGSLSEAQATQQVGTLLNTALDSGINFLDTAACYAASEDYIGNAVSHRRDDYALATKCGHATGELEGEPWSADLIERSVERSLRRLKTDHLDILQIHSCDKQTLERGEVIEAVVKARDAGKTRFIGYSGDNDAAEWAVASGIFDTLQTSLNVVDQRAHSRLLGPAKAQDMGVIIKRPVGNMVWGAIGEPFGPGSYFKRAQAMGKVGPLPEEPDDAVELALGFLFSHDEVDTAIVGTTNLDHLLGNMEFIDNQLPISQATVDELHSRFERLDDGWDQQM